MDTRWSLNRTPVNQRIEVGSALNDGQEVFGRVKRCYDHTQLAKTVGGVC